MPPPQRPLQPAHSLEILLASAKNEAERAAIREQIKASATVDARQVETR